MDAQQPATGHIPDFFEGGTCIRCDRATGYWQIYCQCQNCGSPELPCGAKHCDMCLDHGVGDATNNCVASE